VCVKRISSVGRGDPDKVFYSDRAVIVLNSVEDGEFATKSPANDAKRFWTRSTLCSITEVRCGDHKTEPRSIIDQIEMLYGRKKTRVKFERISSNFSARYIFSLPTGPSRTAFNISRKNLTFFTETRGFNAELRTHTHWKTHNETWKMKN